LTGEQIINVKKNKLMKYQGYYFLGFLAFSISIMLEIFNASMFWIAITNISSFLYFTISLLKLEEDYQKFNYPFKGLLDNSILSTYTKEKTDLTKKEFDSMLKSIEETLEIEEKKPAYIWHSNCDKFFNEFPKYKLDNIYCGILGGILVQKRNIVPKNHIWFVDKEGKIITQFYYLGK